MDTVLIFSIMILGGLGLAFGIALAVAAKVFHVDVDPKIEEILQVLPGANCGACGYPGCSGYAEAIVVDKVDINKCIPGGQGVQQKIAEIMGLSVGDIGETKVAVVQCAGGNNLAKIKAEYQGVQDCEAANLIAGGPKACEYGCIGLGSCVHHCPFDAMYMGDDGLPHVIEDKCTGCGICVSVCPRGVMALIPRSQKVYLACVSQDKGKAVTSVCKVGCIGGGLCAHPKVTPSGSIQMNDNLPVIVKNDADDLLMAVEKCPRKCLKVRDEIKTNAHYLKVSISETGEVIPEKRPCKDREKITMETI